MTEKMSMIGLEILLMKHGAVRTFVRKNCSNTITTDWNARN